jgi:hypothetical protein
MEFINLVAKDFIECASLTKGKIPLAISLKGADYYETIASYKRTLPSASYQRPISPP